MLTTPKVHLYTALANALGPHTVIGDFTEANYVGYASQTAAFGLPYINVAGQAVCDSPLLQFQPTAGTTPNTILGFYVTDSASAVLLWAGTIPTPTPLVTPSDALPLVLQFVLQPPGPPY
jgi:hypothetical protein